MGKRHYNGIIAGLTFLLLCYGAGGYFPRHVDRLQDETPSSRTVITEGNYPILVILSKGTGNPADTLRQPPPPCDIPLSFGLSDALSRPETKQEVKRTAFLEYAGTVYIDVTSTDLIFPFHYFL